MSIRDAIDRNFKEMLGSRTYKAGIENLDRVRLHEDFERLKEDYVTFINFYVYRRRLKVMKLRQGRLSAGLEKDVLSRGKSALAIYQRMCNTLDKITASLTKARLINAINRNSPQVFAHLPHNPKFPVVVDEFRAMGVPEDAIEWVVVSLRDADYNPLAAAGGNGRFQSLAQRAQKLVPALGADLTRTAKLGLPILAGAGDDEDEYVAAGVTVAIAIIVGLIFGFCQDWRESGLPHVQHWSS
jgi:hypothetical protein